MVFFSFRLILLSLLLFIFFLCYSSSFLYHFLYLIPCFAILICFIFSLVFFFLLYPIYPLFSSLFLLFLLFSYFYCLLLLIILLSLLYRGVGGLNPHVHNLVTPYVAARSEKAATTRTQWTLRSLSLPEMMCSIKMGCSGLKCGCVMEVAASPAMTKLERDQKGYPQKGIHEKVKCARF